MSRRNIRIVVGLMLLVLSIPIFILIGGMENRSRFTPLSAGEEREFAQYAEQHRAMATHLILEAHGVRLAEARRHLQKPITTMRCIWYGLLIVGLLALLVPMRPERPRVIPGMRPRNLRT